MRNKMGNIKNNGFSKSSLRIVLVRHKISTIIIISTLMLISFNQTSVLTRIRLMVRNDIHCYRDQSLATLPNILDDEPPKGKSIFFHETSCSSHAAGKIVITPRQACAVESAALLNPESNVYLLFTSSGIVKQENTLSDRLLKHLLSYKNVKIRHLDFGSYVRGSPVAGLFDDLSLEKSYYSNSHASDILRYLTLWRYGGIYMDLDVVIVRMLQDLKPNYAGRESEENVAAGIMNFDYQGIGHQWARECLEDLKKNFNGNDWGYNGPGVITRFLKKLCSARRAVEMTPNKCQGFTVFGPSAFYPVPWTNWTAYFRETEAEEVSFQDSFAIHVWNKHSISQPVSERSVYGRIAARYCPMSYAESGDNF